MYDIPKKIHYCWFGGNPLPELAIKCINSWKKNFPGYEIIEWNENNYDIHKNQYISQAYENKKYAFVSDYARFDILYNCGGLYFDTDVEVISDFTKIIDSGPFMGTEVPGSVAAGLGLGAIPGMKIYKEIIDYYDKITFVNKDGSFNQETVVEKVTKILKTRGFLNKDVIQKIEDVTIYPVEFFCPKNYFTGEINITKNTVAIHHYTASWKSEYDKKVSERTYRIYKKYGVNCFSKAIIIIYRIYSKIIEFGLFETMMYYIFKKELNTKM